MKGFLGFVVEGWSGEVVFACVLDYMLLILFVDTCDMRFLKMSFCWGKRLEVSVLGVSWANKKTQKGRLF